jgi:transposase, IS5 family
VFRTVGDQPGLWESILPSELLVLPVELTRVDQLLDDPAFFAPFVGFFDPRRGRPSTPMETYLRLMFLKFRYRLGYESLCREVSDSITWRRFCRIPLDGVVPHPTTLMKLTTRCGSVAVEGLNEALLVKAAQAKLLRTNRLRADTTVVCADVAYPTDSGLLARAIRRIAATGRGDPGRGWRRPDAVAGPEPVSRQAGACDRGETAAAHRGGPRRGPGHGAADHRTARRTCRALRDAQRLLVNARRGLTRAAAKAADLAAVGGRDPAAGRRRGRLRRAVNDLVKLIDAARQIAAHRSTGRRDHPGRASRRVSLHDPDARPIAKGRLGKPVELGAKAQILTTKTGSCSTPLLSRATRRTRRSWPRPSNGSSAALGVLPALSPPTVATARNASRTTSTTSGYVTLSSPARANRARPGNNANTGRRSAKQ